MNISLGVANFESTLLQGVKYLLNEIACFAILKPRPVFPNTIDVRVLPVVHEVARQTHQPVRHGWDIFPYGFMGYDHVAEGVEEVCCLPQGCLHPGPDALLHGIIGIMFPVTLIGGFCSEGIPADVTLHPEYGANLHCHETGSFPHHILCAAMGGFVRLIRSFSSSSISIMGMLLTLKTWEESTEA